MLPMTIAQTSDLEELKCANEILQVTVANLQNTNAYLTQQLDWFKRQIFGKKSERILSDCNSQQLLLEGFEGLVEQGKQQAQDVPAHQRRKPKRDGQDAIALDPNLPVKTTVLDLPEEKKICKETGAPLQGTDH